MTDSEINEIVSILPARLDLDDECAVLDYIILRICPAINIRPSDAGAAFPDMLKRARALRLVRAA